MIVEGFKPEVNCKDKNPKILILGTLPGPKSISVGKYYQKETNRLWETIDKAYGTNLSFLNYDEKIKILFENHIALWDVLKKSERYGYKDKKIRINKDSIFNDLDSFIKNNNIKVVIFNGYPSYEIFKSEMNPYKKSLNNNRVDVIVITSTSGVNSHWNEYKGAEALIQTLKDFKNKYN